MACKGTRVTETEVMKMVELYDKYRNFRKVGQMMRRNPNTVSKYVNQWLAIHGYVNQLTREMIMPKISVAYGTQDFDITF